MIIIHNYDLQSKYSSDFLYVKSHETNVCPFCGGALKVEGSRRRSYLAYDGTKKELMIRRLRCTNCNHIHHELPDILVPYKRYDSETIENIISVNEEHKDDYPCELSTAVRIKLWFYFLKCYFESTLEALKTMFAYDKELFADISKLLPLLPLRRHPAGWLKSLVRYIVNTGRWVQIRSA